MALAAPFPAAGTASPRAYSRPASPSRRRPADSPSAGIRLTPRGRIVLLVLSTLFLFVVVLMSGRFTADAGTTRGSQGVGTGVVVVQQGESLWQIARQIAPAADPREIVSAIRELNGLGESTVEAGQSIVVPVAGSIPAAS